MSPLAWVAFAVGVFILAVFAFAVGAMLRYWLALPPDERRPIREMPGELRHELAELRREGAERRMARRLMYAKGRRAMRQIHDEQYERALAEVRRQQQQPSEPTRRPPGPAGWEG